MDKHFVVMLIHYQGGSASCTGSTPEEAGSQADKLQAKYAKKTYVFRTPCYEATSSTKFPGVWDVSIPHEILDTMSDDVVKLYRELGD